jgi:hypothetical protein
MNTRKAELKRAVDLIGLGWRHVDEVNSCPHTSL